MAINWIQYPDYTSLSTGDKIIVSAPDGNTKKVPASAITSSVDTLQEITDNGNTTTNSINIGSSTSPAKKLTVTTSTIGDGILGTSSDGYTWAQLQNDNSTTTPVGTLRLYYGTSQSVKLTALSNEMKLGDSQNTMTFFTASSEKMRLTSDGKLGLGTSSPDAILHIKDVNPRIIKLQDANYTNQYATIGFDDGHIRLSSDPDNQRANSIIAFSIDNSLKMLLTSDGNLGINQVNPTEKLHVVGDALITGDSHADAFKPAATGEPIKFKNFGSTELARITDGGNLGIGTNNPEAVLEIESSSANLLKLYRTNSSAAAESIISFDFNNASAVQTNYAQIRADIGISTDGSHDGILQFHTAESGTVSEKMRLTSGGNLLIGTTTNSAKLTVDETTTNNLTVAHFKHNQGAVISDILLENSAGANNTGFNINFKLASSGASAKIGAIRTNSPGAGDTDMVFSTSTNGASVNEAMRITHDSNVLIGTTTDSSHKLNVNGDINLPLNSNIRFGGQLALLKENNGEFNFYGGTNSTNGGFDFKTWTGSTYSTSFLIRNSGNVLIGTTTDDGSSKLQVNGNATLSGSLTAPNATFSGNLLAGTFRSSRTDGDLYIQAATASDFVAIGTQVSGQANLMRVLGNGNVLIGTTTDGGEKLQVAGTASFVNTGNGQIDITRTSGATTFIQSQTATGVIGTSTNHKLDLKTNGSTRLRITNGGNVLIGTTTDSGNKLEVVGYVKASIGYKTGTYGLVYESSNELNIKNTAYYGINFHTNNAQRMKLTNAGNLLIGTTSDSGEKLVINGAVKIGSHLTLQQDGGNDQIKSTGSVLYVKANEYSFQDNSNNQRFKIATNGAATFYQSLTGTTATFSGNIKSGFETSTSTAQVLIQTRSADNAQLALMDGTNSNVILQRPAGTTDMGFITGGSNRMRLTSGGNLLLGTTTDSGDKLQVNGDIKINDGDMLRIGDSSDLKLYHTGTGTVIQNAVGNLTIQQDQNDGDIIFRCDDGIGGTAEYFRLDGSQASSNYYYTKFADKSSIVFGDSNDLRIYHDSNDSSIENEFGNLYIQQKANSKDIIFRCDNGTGGVAEYITLDGSQTTINLQKNVLIGTTTNSGVYKLDVFGKARVQSVFELDDVLTLNQISTPADPASGKSSIYMDSADGAIKVKINVGGTVVTRTLASFEG